MVLDRSWFSESNALTVTAGGRNATEPLPFGHRIVFNLLARYPASHEKGGSYGASESRKDAEEPAETNSDVPDSATNLVSGAANWGLAGQGQ